MHGQSDRSELYRPTERFCVWIVGVGDWQPAHVLDMPPRALAVEPAEDRTMSAVEADVYIAGFNEKALADGSSYWALRVPVRCFVGSAIAAGQWLGE